MLCFFYSATVVFEIRAFVPGVLVIVDADHQGVSPVMFKSVQIFLLSDLIHGRIGAFSILQFNQKGRFFRKMRRRQIGQIRIALACVKFLNRRVVFLRSVISELNAVAQGRLVVVGSIARAVVGILDQFGYFFLISIPCSLEQIE